MKTYICDDGNAEVRIEAETPEDAAQEYADPKIIFENLKKPLDINTHWV